MSSPHGVLGLYAGRFQSLRNTDCLVGTFLYALAACSTDASINDGLVMAQRNRIDGTDIDAKTAPGAFLFVHRRRHDLIRFPLHLPARAETHALTSPHALPHALTATHALPHALTGTHALTSALTPSLTSALTPALTSSLAPALGGRALSITLRHFRVPFVCHGLSFALASMSFIVP